MNLEIISFRVALVIAVLSLILCGGFSGYSYQQAQGWEEAIDINYERLSACRGSDNRNTCVLPIDELEENYDRSVINRILYMQRAILSVNLMWLLPVFTLLVFYSVRWLVLGRLGPFWPRPSPRDKPAN